MSRRGASFFGPDLFKFLRDLKRHNEREWFLKNKRDEWRRYRRHVSLFEVEENLPIL